MVCTLAGSNVKFLSLSLRLSLLVRYENYVCISRTCFIPSVIGGKNPSRTLDNALTDPGECCSSLDRKERDPIRFLTFPLTFCTQTRTRYIPTARRCHFVATLTAAARARFAGRGKLNCINIDDTAKGGRRSPRVVSIESFARN